MKAFTDALIVVLGAAFAGYLLGAHPQDGLAAGLLLAGSFLWAYLQANRD